MFGIKYSQCISSRHRLAETSDAVGDPIKKTTKVECPLECVEGGDTEGTSLRRVGACCSRKEAIVIPFGVAEASLAM
jgi:hypothetical protein